jgi:hypothetical protein
VTHAIGTPCGSISWRTWAKGRLYRGHRGRRADEAGISIFNRLGDNRDVRAVEYFSSPTSGETPAGMTVLAQQADEHAQTSVSEHGDRHSTRPAGAPDGAEAARRVARGGRAAIDRQHPSSRGRGAEGLRPGAASLHSGHFRGTGAPNRGPGRTLIPGDGAAGDQRAQNRPACPAMRLRDACGLSRNDFLALWSQAHLPSCNRQVTSTSIHMARPGPATAPRSHAPL